MDEMSVDTTRFTKLALERPKFGEPCPGFIRGQPVLRILIH